ncbi:alkaline phosphatase D family protein [Jatrophihabitans endophyticus]|uniref:alkaline phosphatase D family protein n=1 Tax=Jatrophihabitans endophyticus TaxID=1206085 RepID=UPI001A03F87C|nr:alkaline phosphatase D family protein [Jatrophihabitans endophyticus]MBE7188030.1 alkaline phosphatase family protein [Jatrophihabitans endophyticus]
MTRLLVGPVLRYVGTTDATVWVETDEPCEVSVTVGGATHADRTWTVAGHHYALVIVDGLAAGSSAPYEVRLDGTTAWPAPGSTRPASQIRTLSDHRPLRLAFGSCRYGRAAMMRGDRHFAPDALACYARDLARLPVDDPGRPDAILMLGDQVYADETSEATRRRIRARRDITTGAEDQVADFEEYTWLYLESWTDPDVRWLMSTVPSSMIFDDHDVRDDWNTSHAWRVEMQRTDWWQERIVGGLMSYWVYQHLGNLTPDALRADELFQRVRAHDGPTDELLRAFATRADAEADGAKGARWSYRRDFGRTRMIMIDSRCGRILAGGERSMVSRDEFAWLESQVDGDYDHLLIGTSLPWLLTRALHDLEAWDEVLCDGSHPRLARFGEWLRRAADLEHWAAFGDSFEWLTELVGRVGSGPAAPATVCVLSGDVHHAYIAEAHYPRPLGSRVFQLTCSPLHNYVPAMMKVLFRVFWSRLMERFFRVLLGVVAEVPVPSVRWTRSVGPLFRNELAEFVADGRSAVTLLRQPASSSDDSGLTELTRLRLSG